ncbi:hypothetical protein ACQ4PT_060195 [Festuca glaucescens]
MLEQDRGKGDETMLEKDRGKGDETILEQDRGKGDEMMLEQDRGKGHETMLEQDRGKGDETMLEKDRGKGDETILEQDRGKGDEMMLEQDRGKGDETMLEQDRGKGDETMLEKDRGKGDETILEQDRGKETFEPFLDISLEIDQVDDLVAALESFIKVEQLGDAENKLNCESCNGQVCKDKQLVLDTTPDVVAFQLKRFTVTLDGYIEKIDKHVAYPLQLDLHLFHTNLDKEGLKYDLYGIVKHSGLPNFGHYMCTIRSSPTSWHLMNDSLVDSISETSALNQEAYMLFYVRQGMFPWFSSVLQEANSGAPSATKRMYPVNDHNVFAFDNSGKEQQSTEGSTLLNVASSSCESPAAAHRRNSQAAAHIASSRSPSPAAAPVTIRRPPSPAAAPCRQKLLPSTSTSDLAAPLQIRPPEGKNHTFKSWMKRTTGERKREAARTHARERIQQRGAVEEKAAAWVGRGWREGGRRRRVVVGAVGWRSALSGGRGEDDEVGVVFPGTAELVGHFSG